MSKILHLALDGETAPTWEEEQPQAEIDAIKAKAQADIKKHRIEKGEIGKSAYIEGKS